MPVMENENGGLSILERSIPTIRQKSKQTGEYAGQGMGDPWQKGTRNNMVVLGGVGSF